MWDFLLTDLDQIPLLGKVWRHHCWNHLWKGIGESSSHITISSMASSSELPGSFESISSSESSVDGEEDSVGFLTGKSLAGGGSSSLSAIVSLGWSLPLFIMMTWASSSDPFFQRHGRSIKWRVDWWRTDRSVNGPWHTIFDLQPSPQRCVIQHSGRDKAIWIGSSTACCADQGLGFDWAAEGDVSDFSGGSPLASTYIGLWLADVVRVRHLDRYKW